MADNIKAQEQHHLDGVIQKNQSCRNKSSKED